MKISENYDSFTAQSEETHQPQLGITQKFFAHLYIL